MKDFISSTVFEVVDGKFVFRGWHVRGDHIFKKTVQGIAFGKTEILLKLVDGKPKLEIPAGQSATLLQSNHAFINQERVDGAFVEVQIN